MKKFIAIWRNPYFLLLILSFLVCIFFHYPQQIPFLHLKFSSILPLERHAVERILFLIPIILSGLIFGLKGGLICLVLALITMLPRVLFLSYYFVDALFETIAVTVVGAIINWGIESHRREIGQREQALLRLETVRKELQAYISIIRENEKHLSLLYSITTTVNQLISLDEILNTVADKLKEVIDIDGLLIFLLNVKNQSLELKIFRGVSEEFAYQVHGLKVGEGFNGWVAKTGEPYLVEDSLTDYRLSKEIVKREGIRSQFIIPLMSRKKVVGTFCVLTRVVRAFTKEEIDILSLIGTEFGGAIEKALLYGESEKINERFRELVHQITRAHEEERKRIARELHDDSIQSLVVLSRQIDTLITGESEFSKITMDLEKIREEIDEIMIGMRRFIQDLRPPTLEYLGLIPALRELVSQFQQQTGIPTEFLVTGTEQHFAPENRILIYRIIQEALRNIWKHSGAKKAEVFLEFHKDKTIIKVEDNGKGFELKEELNFIHSGKIGLAGLQERARLLSGNLTIHSNPGQGTKVILEIQGENK